MRKYIRLKDYDYSQAGCYFVTICVKGRRKVLGRIVVVGDAALGVPGGAGVPFVELSDIGEMVKQHIRNINQQGGITLDNFVIMPNHIHLLIHLDSGTPINNETPRAASPTKAIIPQIINALKGLTSKKFGETLWQRAYYDHIIRNEDEYQKIWRYIDTNPAKWEEDSYF